MLTKFSKWMIYVASYLPLYILLVIKIFSEKHIPPKTWQNIINDNLLFLSIAALLILISLLWFYHMNKWNNNTKVRCRLKKNITIESVGFVIPYLISLITINIDQFGIILNIVIFIILGIAFVGSGKINLSPVFLLMGYKLYESESGYVLSKFSLDSFNLLIEENSNGINARQIGKGIYIHL